jgi:GNAT superfamily N-acetyltransferase
MLGRASCAAFLVPEADMAETLTVRVAGSADIAAVDALLARAYPALLRADYPPSLQVLAVPLIARANARLVCSGRYYVVEEAGSLVGAGGWSRSSPPWRNGGRVRRRLGHVRHVVTDHRRTRRGIGRSLMARVLADASASGVAVMECLSTRTAVPFYVACGFLEIDRCEVALAPGIDFPVVRMARRLLP